MTTTYTRQMIASEALSLLFQDGIANDPAPEDIERVDQKIDALFAELDARDVVSVPDPDDIEPAHFSALAELLANECAPLFNKPKNEMGRLAAEDRLREIVRAAPVYKLKTDPLLRAGQRRRAIYRGGW